MHGSVKYFIQYGSSFCITVYYKVKLLNYLRGEGKFNCERPTNFMGKCGFVGGRDWYVGLIIVLFFIFLLFDQNLFVGIIFLFSHRPTWCSKMTAFLFSVQVNFKFLYALRVLLVFYLAYGIL